MDTCIEDFTFLKTAPRAFYSCTPRQPIVYVYMCVCVCACVCVCVGGFGAAQL
jgi:hypothetical protein